MPDLIQKALEAKRESKYIEFKHGFDPSSPAEWCEVIKDLVAIANSGGGIIVFGLDSVGKPTDTCLDELGRVDPADFANRIAKYTGSVELDFEIRVLDKDGHTLFAFIIQPVSVPIVFQKPGTYDIGSGKQRAAFSVGTVYFRHGAKSEPGTTDDIRLVIERQLESIRKSWISNVRKVVQAPPGSRIVTVQPAGRPGTLPLPTSVRFVKDPNATPVLLTRDPTKATGSFVHEEVSEGIFDEINNVLDANQALARGQRHFFLGPPIYYRVYAERHHVAKREDHVDLLFHSAAADLYAPALFWTLALPEHLIAKTLVELYLHPKNPVIHFLLRMSVLLGKDLCNWLQERWDRKWSGYAQPPSFYWTFKEMVSKMTSTDPRVASARVAVSTRLEIPGLPTVGVAELLDDPRQASSLLSKCCIRVFEGERTLRATTRVLDYFAYGLQVRERAPTITKAIIASVGNREAGDLIGTAEAEA